MGPGEELGICCRDGTQDVYPHHPEDLDMDWSASRYLSTISDNYCYCSRYLQSNFSKILSIITDIKESGEEVTSYVIVLASGKVCGRQQLLQGGGPRHGHHQVPQGQPPYLCSIICNILLLLSAASTSPCCATPWAAPRTRRRSCELALVQVVYNSCQ